MCRYTALASDQLFSLIYFRFQSCLDSFSKMADQQQADDFVNNFANSMKDGKDSPGADIHSFDNPTAGLPRGY